MVKERREGSKIPASYTCPSCDTTYKTKKEAEACYRFNFETFKKGAIIEWCGKPYILRYDLTNDGTKEQLFSVDKHTLLAKAMGCIHVKKESLAIPYKYFCKANPLKLYDLTKVRSRLKDAKASVKALEGVLKNGN